MRCAERARRSGRIISATPARRGWRTIPLGVEPLRIEVMPKDDDTGIEHRDATENKMTLIGFRAQNHAQQVTANGPKDEVDDRGTDPSFIAEVQSRFGDFTLDAAAAAHNHKAPAYYTRDDNGLNKDWFGNVWCNPPYSDCGAWVRKAWHEWCRHIDPTAATAGSTIVCGGCALTRTSDTTRDLPRPERIVMLLPANRVEQAWWQDHVEPFRDRPGSPLRVEFLRGRMRFHRPGWTPGPKGDRPPFGCVLLIWEEPDATWQAPHA